MNDTFVPLFSKPAAKANGSFKPIAAASFPGSSSSAASTSSSAASEKCGQPIVTLERSGDTISSIRVQCPCGQVIDLQCDY